MISRINVYRKADIVYGSAIHPMPTVGASFTRDRRSCDLEEVSAELYRAPMEGGHCPPFPNALTAPQTNSNFIVIPPQIGL